ncbi:adhesion G protein-coupled receptor L4 isoform X2 [Fundulus heteroclitus]|uniref:Adhesion G protein-coupled receptor L4 n=1 Tax=Fundulus heteroclitus TaxID=8078 RepID=A0A3Q2Q8V5_FUNHE|nr:adhesion G protein-coupled receptor L4 isoform X2 [Fundulus heteroclitus]
MESSLNSPMKRLLFIAWLWSLMDTGLFDICQSCHQHATCKSKNGSSPICLCNYGYTGDGIAFCNDDNECQNVTNICGEKGKCTNTEGSYYCTCVSGYVSTGETRFQTNDGTRCTDIDECEREQACGPNSRCHNTNGSFYCSCQRDYISTSGDKHFQAERGVRCKEHPQKYCHDNIGCMAQAVNRTLENQLVKAVNNLVEQDELVAWNRMRQERREHTITKLLHVVEESALSLGNNHKTPTELQIKASEMELKLFTFDASQTKTKLSVSMGGDHIDLTPKLKPEDKTSGCVSVVFVRYDSISDILKPSSDPGVTDYSRYAGTGEITVNSQVMAAAVKPADVYQLDHVTFTLGHNEPIDTRTDVTKCAFWEYEVDSLQGHWSTQGCKTLHVTSNATNCSCNHLTHFAILMSSGRANLAAHNTILTRISQLGMIISLICLSLCIFTFWFFSEIQSTRTTIHKNLCCSLFMAEFIFLVGINMNSHKLFCSVIAGMLHYFFLAAFAWMCIEGIHLYLIVVGVIYNKGFLHRNFYIFGYGSPAVVVAISATLGSKYYGTDKVCWLSTENHFVWSFIGPACLIILVNLLAFGVIIYKVYRHTAVKKPEISHYENIRSCARGAMALLFVLGATWTFGVLHILHETTLTAYLFTITNAFQGMFIFIFLCVLSRKIQEEYYRLFKNVPCCFEYLR